MISKTKTHRTLYTWFFSRALRKFQVIARNSDQLLVLFAPVVIGCYSVWNWFFESHSKIAQYWYLILFTGCSWTARDKRSRGWKGSSGKLNKNCFRIFHVYYLLLRPFAKETKRFRAVQQLLQTTRARWSWTKSKILYVILYLLKQQPFFSISLRGSVNFLSHLDFKE